MEKQNESQLRLGTEIAVYTLEMYHHSKIYTSI